MRTGRRLTREFDVDHCFPFAAWPCNDLWNLLPSAPDALEQAKPRMLEWWDVAYLRNAALAERFDDESWSALPLAISDSGAVTPESLFEGVMVQQMVPKRDQQLAEWLP